MTSMIRTTALAAALAAFSVGTFAANVTLPEIDFEDLGALALKPLDPKGNVTTGTAVPVTSYKGFVFSGVFAYHADMLGKDGTSSADPDFLTGTKGGFLMNRQRSFDPPPQALVMDLGDAFRQAGQFFTALSLLQFNTAETTVSLYSNKGTQFVGSNTYSPSQGGNWTTTKTYQFVDTDQVDRIVFSATDPQAPGLIGWDNLVVSLTAATTDPNPAPEPASFALVGLALLAAGAASRRRG